LEELVNKLKAILVALLLAGTALVGVHVVTSAPANASPYCTYGGNCGGILHWWDDGYDQAFIVACNRNNLWGSAVNVAEGNWDSCSDADAIYVRSGEQIVCTNNWGQWQIKYDATGWHNIYDNERPHCVAQLD
jgi:hypothetical protein